MPTESLHLTAEFIVLWMLPVSLLVLVWLFTRNASRRASRAVRLVLDAVIVGYFLATIPLDLWPFNFDLSIARVFRSGNFVPLHGSLSVLVTHASRRAYLKHDFLHVVLLMPVGVLLPLRHRSRLRLWVVAALSVVVVLLAFGLEVVQGITVLGRDFDIDDAIAGAAGGLAAVAVGSFVRSAVDRWGRAPASGPR
jgi:glycopeptide antibiotics resistance protein